MSPKQFVNDLLIEYLSSIDSYSIKNKQRAYDHVLTQLDDSQFLTNRFQFYTDPSQFRAECAFLDLCRKLIKLDDFDHLWE